MGCPRGITDKKYDRNTLIFNFGFVFDKDCDTVPFESVVRKLGASFRIYEVCVVHGWSPSGCLCGAIMHIKLLLAAISGVIKIRSTFCAPISNYIYL